MKRLIYVVGFMTVSTQANATISIVQKSSSTVGAAPINSTFTATTAGSGIVIAVMLTNITRIPSINDNKLNTYTLLNTATSTNTANTQQVYIFEAANVTAATSSATVKLNGAGSLGGVWMWEIAGGATTNGTFFDVGSSSQNATASTSMVGAPLTATGSGEIVIAASAAGGSSTGASAPYTFSLGTAGGHGSAHHISPTSGVSENVTFTGSSGTGCVSMAAFCPTGGCVAATVAVNSPSLFGSGLVCGNCQ